MLLQTNTEQMIVCLNNLVPTVSGKMWNITDHFLIMIWYDDWSRMLITMPEWLVTELYRLMLRHSKRDRVYTEPIPYSGSMVVPSSVWRGQDYWTGPNHTGKYWEPVLRLTLCVRHLSAGTWVTIKSPKSLGASHLRWYFLCKLTLIHWSAGVSITLKNQVFYTA